MLNKIGMTVDGKVTSITKFGAFVLLDKSVSGMIHISEISDGFVKDINDFLKVGMQVRVKICSVDENGRIALSLKQAEKQEVQVENDRNAGPVAAAVKKKKQNDADPFEEMMASFLKTSNEKMSDLRKTVESKRGSGGFSRKNVKKY